MSLSQRVFDLGFFIIAAPLLAPHGIAAAEQTVANLRGAAPPAADIIEHIGGRKLQSDCKDTDWQCAPWAEMGECKANPDYMSVNCPVSCGTCTSAGPTTPEPTTPEPTTPEPTTSGSTPEQTTSEPTTPEPTTPEPTTPEPTTPEPTTPEPTTSEPTTSESTTTEPTTPEPTTPEPTTPEPTTQAPTTQAPTTPWMPSPPRPIPGYGDCQKYGFSINTCYTRYGFVDGDCLCAPGLWDGRYTWYQWVCTKKHGAPHQAYFCDQACQSCHP